MDFRNKMPSGEIQGDDRPLPDRGTGTGMNPATFSQGRSMDRDATNSMGSAHVSPDEMYRRSGIDQQKRAGSGASPNSGGSAIGSETDSDDMFDRTPGDE